MKTASAIGFILAPVAFLMFAGCGTIINPYSAPSTVAIQPTGNWLLTGNRAQGQYPVLSLALYVSGNQVVAFSDLYAKCAPATSFIQFEEVGGYMTGVVATDGSFQLGIQQIDLPYSISGVVPAAGATTWTGTYTIASSNACTVNQTSQFTATVLPGYNGTYAGTLGTSSSTTHPAQIGFTSTFTQGATFASAVSNGLTTYYLPLDATVTVSGSTCFTHGVAVPGFNSSVEGEAFQVTDTMDDGSTLWLFGTFADPAGDSINVALTITGGSCDHATWNGTLTRH